VVRAIDAARIVDKIRVAATACQTEFHPSQLGQAQITTLPYNTAAQLSTVDTQRIVSFVTHLRV
jgi:hypothetical protein